MKADSIKGELESYASTVNNFILAFVEGTPKELYHASSHYIRTGGKRLRPFMVLKSCELLGGSAERALPAAAAVELVHNLDRKSTRLNSSHANISYAVFCLKKKTSLLLHTLV